MFVMSTKLYDFLKKLVQIVLPAFSSAYFALASIWEWGGTDKVVGTIAVLTTFLGVCLGISSSTYNKLDRAYDGNLNIGEDDGKRIFQIELTAEPEVLEPKDAIRLRVRRDQPLRAMDEG